MRSALLLTLVLVSSGLSPRLAAQVPGDTTAYAVTYVEVASSSGGAMSTAFKQYRDASRKEDGSLQVELLEQAGRPGHFIIIEAWRDQRAFEAHGMAGALKQFQTAVMPVRISGYDQRPYKPISIASASRAATKDAVYVVSHVDIGGNLQGIDSSAMLKRLAEASRSEAGNLRFDVLQHAMRANHFTVVEVWQNQKALDAHVAAPHTKQYRDVLQPISGSPVDERSLKAVD